MLPLSAKHILWIEIGKAKSLKAFNNKYVHGMHTIKFIKLSASNFGCCWSLVSSVVSMLSRSHSGMADNLWRSAEICRSREILKSPPKKRTFERLFLETY